MSCHGAMCTEDERQRPRIHIYPREVRARASGDQNRPLMRRASATPAIFIRALMTAELMRPASYQEPLISH